jgi:hypothetical protein
MFPPFDIFRVESDGQLLWQESAQTLALARSRVSVLRLAKRADYVIYSQQSGHSSVVRQNDSQSEHPICPKHDTFMVPHRFETWELTSRGGGTLDGFRCPNLNCSIVYIETLEGFHTLADCKLTRLAPSKKAPPSAPKS